MSTGRQNANIWSAVFLNLYYFRNNKYYTFTVYIHDIIRCFKSSYFWQDSFRTHFKRLFGCKHKYISLIEDDKTNQYTQKFCFDCYRKIQ